MDGETDCSPLPTEWLNKDFIASALQEEYGDKHLKVASLSAETMRMNSYMSNMYRASTTVKTEGTGEAQAWHLVLKCALKRGPLLEFSEGILAFHREALLLTKLVPDMDVALGTAWRPLGPRCFLAAAQPVRVLVMEDLAAAGYGPAPEGFLDEKHCSLVLRSLAHWHGASCALSLQEAGATADGLLHHDPCWGPHGRTVFTSTNEIHLRSVAATLAQFPDCAPYAEKFLALSRSYFEKAAGVINQKRLQSNFKVLVHGDVWKNNIMFKYTEGQPTDLRFIDFQLSHLASPARDIVFFLYGNASEDVHRHHTEHLLSEYHGALQDTLRALGLHQQADAYPLHQLRQDMDDLALLGLHCASYAALFTSSDKYGEDFLNCVKGTSGCSDVLVEIYTNPRFMSYFRFICPLFEGKGVL